MFALYVRQKTLLSKLQILPTVKISFHIPMSLLSLKNWEAVTRIIDGVRLFMRVHNYNYFTIVC